MTKHSILKCVFQNIISMKPLARIGVFPRKILWFRLQQCRMRGNLLNISFHPSSWNSPKPDTWILLYPLLYTQMRIFQMVFKTVCTKKFIREEDVFGCTTTLMLPLIRGVWSHSHSRSHGSASLARSREMNFLGACGTGLRICHLALGTHLGQYVKVVVTNEHRASKQEVARGSKVYPKGGFQNHGVPGASKEAGGKACGLPSRLPHRVTIFSRVFLLT